MARSKLKIEIDNLIRAYGNGTYTNPATVTDNILKMISLEASRTKAGRTRMVHRDAVTGKFLPKEVAESRPNTSIFQKIKRRFRPQ